jgi:DNA polymerase-3 subunit delta'
MSLKDIKGQDKPIEIIKGQLRQGRLGSSYLFSGPEGIGKSLVAGELAKLINCYDNKSGDSCGSCGSCVKIDKASHPDVHWVSADAYGANAVEAGGDSIKIEQVRQLKKDIYLKPYEAKIKTFIIDDADKLTLEAANALLKILEEPPRDSLIILVTSKPQLLPETIVSRCRRLKFAALGKDALREALKNDYGLGPALSHYLAYFCEGRLGMALRLKDEEPLLNKNKIIDYFMPASRSSSEEYPDSEFKKQAIAESFEVLASWFRDIYFIKIGMPHTQLINIDRKSDLINAMGRYSPAQLDSIFNFLSDAALYLEQNINQKLLLSNLRMALKA